MSNLDEMEQGALAALLGAIRDPQRLLTTWQEKEMFDTEGEDGMRLSRGASGTAEVNAVAQGYLNAVGRRLPMLLLSFLYACNGYEIRTIEGDGLTVIDGDEFDIINGLLPARHLESAETGEGRSGVLIGKAYDQCRVILVDEGPEAGMVVFDDGDGDVVLAPTLAIFFHDLVAHGLSVDAVVSTRDTR